MQTSFRSSLLARLARLHLATESGAHALAHIFLRIRGTTARFIATDGRLLAILTVALADDPAQATAEADLLLDAPQLRAAAEALSALTAGQVSLQLAVDQRELRLATAHQAYLVRIHDGTYPVQGVDRLLAHHRAAAWCPTIATLDCSLVQRARKLIGGKPTPCFRSPVTADSPIRQLWEPVAPSVSSRAGAAVPASIPMSAISPLLTAPACWADDALLVLIMSMTRGPAEPIDLHRWCDPAPVPATIAA